MHSTEQTITALKTLKKDKKGEYNVLLNTTSKALVAESPEIEDTVLNLCIGIYNAGPSVAGDICLALGLLFIEEDVS